MANIKNVALSIPEYLLILAVLFYWLSSAAFNPIAITLLIVLIFQIIFKNRIVGLLLASLIILMSLYMILAVFSEFNEFPTFSYEAKRLLAVGLSFFVSTIIVSGIMIYKYLPKGEKLSSMGA